MGLERKLDTSSSMILNSGTAAIGSGPEHGGNRAQTGKYGDPQRRRLFIAVFWHGKASRTYQLT